MSRQPTTDTRQPGTLPLVSVLIPARNEEAFIERCLTDIMSGDYPHDRLEVLVLDGGSTDGTVAVVERVAQASGWGNVRVVDNPGKTQARAMTLGIGMAAGEFICRIDAHCAYPADYITKLAGYLLQYPDVYNVAGLLKVKPSGNSAPAVAIATAYAHRFATGNACQRVGVSRPTYVDTVGLGLYRRETFERFGLFDTDLLRAEDQEMNCRIIKGGGKVLCVPDVSFDYYARATYGLFARMFYQYGLFKPLAARKMGKPITLRHFAPFAALVLAITCLASAAVLGSPRPLALLAALVCAYLALSLVSACDAVRRKGQSVWLIPGACAAFWTAHSCFALGNVVGLTRFVLLRRRFADIGVSR